MHGPDHGQPNPAATARRGAAAAQKFGTLADPAFEDLTEEGQRRVSAVWDPVCGLLSQHELLIKENGLAQIEAEISQGVLVLPYSDGGWVDDARTEAYLRLAKRVLPPAIPRGAYA